MFTQKTPSNITELLIQSRDRTNYKKRLEAITELGKWKCSQSITRLYELLASDKVYTVKQNAFLNLQKFGESVFLPRKKKGHLIKDINKKLLQVYNSFQAEQYTLIDFKVKFKEKYPEAFDVYKYEKRNNFDNWIQSVVKHSPMKRLKNLYRIKISFNCSSQETDIYSGNISYKGASNNFDNISITNKNIIIIAERSAIINPREILDNDSNTIHTQINKSLLFYYLNAGEYVEIESIVITREKNVVLQEFQLPNAGARLSQVLQSTFHISNAISFETEQLEAIFRSDEKSLALYNAISYMLKANVANESSSKFEKLWKALNSIYRYLGNGKPENESQRILRTFLIENESLFTLTKNQVTQLDKDTLREKVRFRDLILNDYDKKNLTVTFLSFIYRYSDHRISKILRETLVYREEFIKDIMSIENVENRFKKLTNVTFLYNDCKENSIANCIYDKVTDYLDSNFNNKTTLDIEVVTFICIKYAYYIRNKIFHAEKHDLSFKFTENKLTEELDWLNKILEILILELIKVNQIWNQSE